MVFDRIASVLTKRYKMVIIVWIAALLIAVPAIMSVNSVISYQQTQGASGDIESNKAQALIAANFQRSVANGTLLIVLQGDNITDAQSRDFVLALQRQIEGSSEIKDLQNVSSIYTSAELVMEQYIMQLGPGLRPAEAQINSTAFLLWGIPQLHVTNWDLTHSDPDAYDATEAQLEGYLYQQQADPNTTAFALGYYQAFAAAWNSTAGNATLADPVVRADFCVNAVAPGFIAGVGARGPTAADAGRPGRIQHHHLQ